MLKSYARNRENRVFWCTDDCYGCEAGTIAFGFLCALNDAGSKGECRFEFQILLQINLIGEDDAAQEQYSVFACPSLFSVPITCQNTELAGLVFEAMTYYGYYDVIPVYYETTLQGKIADAPEDVEMLEIINDALTVSFAYCYDNWEGFAHFLSGNIMNFAQKSGNKDVASVYAKKEKSALNRLEKCLDAFRGN